MTSWHAVVGIHGIGKRQAEDPGRGRRDLAGRWSAALRRGFGVGPGVEAVVAYYAHHLAGAGEPCKEPATRRSCPSRSRRCCCAGRRRSEPRTRWRKAG